jgi:hypothetical protein
MIMIHRGSIFPPQNRLPLSTGLRSIRVIPGSTVTDNGCASTMSLSSFILGRGTYPGQLPMTV